MSLAKDQSLTIVINGKPEEVMKAKRDLINKLQTQVGIRRIRDSGVGYVGRGRCVCVHIFRFGVLVSQPVLNTS